MTFFQKVFIFFEDAMNLLNDLKQTVKIVAELEKALSNMNFLSFEHNKNKLTEYLNRLSICGNYLGLITSDIQKKQDYLKNQLENYKDELENQLRQVGLYFDGNFPKYYLPPFELYFLVNQQVVQLRLGRKVEKTGIFDPQALTRWIKKRYDALTNQQFNRRIFFNELLEAYKIGFIYNFGGCSTHQNLWGRPVPLKLIYKIMTIKTQTRREYPETYFIYDLARLRAEGLRFDNYQIEFGHTREKQSYIIPDLTSSRQERFSTITLHQV